MMQGTRLRYNVDAEIGKHTCLPLGPAKGYIGRVEGQTENAAPYFGISMETYVWFLGRFG